MPQVVLERDGCTGIQQTRHKCLSVRGNVYNAMSYTRLKGRLARLVVDGTEVLELVFSAPVKIPGPH